MSRLRLRRDDRRIDVRLFDNTVTFELNANSFSSSLAFLGPIDAGNASGKGDSAGWMADLVQVSANGAMTFHTS